MRSLALALLLVGLAAASPKFGLYQTYQQDLGDSQSTEDTEELPQNVPSREELEEYLDQALEEAEQLKKGLEVVFPQRQNRRIIPTKAQVQKFFNDIKDNAQKIGKKIGQDLKKYQTQLHETSEILKQQWTQKPLDFQGNIQASLNIAVQFGKKIAAQVYQDIKNNLPAAKEQFAETARAAALKIGEQIKQDLQKYGTKAQEVGQAIVQQWAKNPTDVVGNIQNSINIAKGLGEEVVKQVANEIQEFSKAEEAKAETQQS